VLPYSFFWAGYVSYEVRNLSLVFPFVCLVAGMGADRLIKITLDFLSRVQWGRLKLYPLAIILLAGLLFFGVRLETQIPNQALIDQQLSKQRELILFGLDDQIYETVSNSEPGTMLLTNYPIISYLPGLDKVSIIDPLESYDGYKNILSKYPKIKLVLYRGSGGVDFISKFEADTNSGKQRFLFTDSNYTMVKLLSSGN
jgi:hypothetical protein